MISASLVTCFGSNSSECLTILIRDFLTVNVLRPGVHEVVRLADGLPLSVADAGRKMREWVNGRMGEYPAFREVVLCLISIR